MMLCAEAAQEEQPARPCRKTTGGLEQPDARPMRHCRPGFRHR